MGQVGLSIAHIEEKGKKNIPLPCHAKTPRRRKTPPQKDNKKPILRISVEGPAENPQALLFAHIRKGRKQPVNCPRPRYLRSAAKNDLSIRVKPQPYMGKMRACGVPYALILAYEDSVLGRITAEQFQTLSGSYTQEMEALNRAIPEKETAIQRLREQVSGTDHFISLAKRYTDIQELTPELLRLFIRKIVVHEKDVKWSKHAQQTVEIHYNDIGCVELPQPKGQSTAKGA